MDTENGFKAMSQHADADAPGKTLAPHFIKAEAVRR